MILAPFIRLDKLELAVPSEVAVMIMAEVVD